MEEGVGEKWLNIYKTQSDEQQPTFIFHLQWSLDIDDMISNITNLLREISLRKGVQTSKDDDDYFKFKFEDPMTKAFIEEYFQCDSDGRTRCCEWVDMVRYSMTAVFMSELNHLSKDDRIFISKQTYLMPLEIMRFFTETPVPLMHRFLEIFHIDESLTITSHDEMVLVKYRDLFLSVMTGIVLITSSANIYTTLMQAEIMNVIQCQTRASANLHKIIQ